ncbi:thiamine-phosphate kinase [Candidatus Pelagibacter sp.]|nr:thiamine-phosphate kinase [Candidatus Pelagibacter sp.]
MHEFELIKNYFSKISKKNKSALNLNDDVFFDKKKGIAISVDTYNLGYHFIDFKYPDLVIKKILRSSISDLTCKGVLPKFYFIAGSGNSKTFSKKNLSLISKSLKEEQKKYNILLCGGDTTFSNKLSFTITSLGYSKKIIYRNKALLNDDIYVTGNLGDSFMGLQILKKKIKVSKELKKYFAQKYYLPDIQIKLTKKLLNFANSSIDLSDGLIDDLSKMINNQNLSFTLYENKIPISKNLLKIIKMKTMKKIQLVSNGDDYQILFTASKIKSRIIAQTSKNLGIKISKIGKICSNKKRSVIIDEKGKEIVIKNKGYVHQF